MTIEQWRDQVRARLPEITGDAAVDEGIVEELAQHLASRFDELTSSGTDPDRAFQLAMSEIGDASSDVAKMLKNAVRHTEPAPTPPPDNGNASMISDLLQDIRYGARVLIHNRGFTATSLITLALGIGATTAIFSVVDSVLLRPVPFQDHDRLTMVWETDRNTGTTREPASVPDFLDFRQRSTQFERLEAFRAGEANLNSDDGEPIRLGALAVTHGFLPMLGIQPVVGRTFTADEDRPGGPQVALISERVWDREFQRGADVAGRVMRLSEVEYQIVGVMPASADFGTMQILRHAAYGRAFADRDLRTRVDVWVPLQADPERLPRSTHPIMIAGKLAPGATVAGAQQEVAGIMTDLERNYPENTARGAFVEAMPDVIFGRVKPALRVLMFAVAFVLLITCVNVANLLLARGTTRAREVAVRSAMGANARRLVRQFAAENLLLAFAAAVVGVALAYVGLRVILSLAPPDIPRIGTVGINGSVLLLALGIAIATGVLFGLVPVIQSRRLDIQSALKSEDARSGTPGRRAATRAALVVSEMALAVVLLIGAGLLIKSFWRLSRVDAGFDSSRVVKAEYQLPGRRYYTGSDRLVQPEIHRFNATLEERARAIPGVEAVAIVANHPLDAGFTNSFRVVGREGEGTNWPEISVRFISPGYLETVRLRLIEGRPFGEGDAPAATKVGIINETTARRFFERQEPIGQKIRFWGIEWLIVGVVADERIHGITNAAPPAIYVPLAQVAMTEGTLLARVSEEMDPAAMTNSLRGVIREIDPLLPVFGVEPLSQTVAESIGQQRFLMWLLGLFAAVAVLLAAVGIHGIVSYSVAQRRHEIGIRMALGARASEVMTMVLAQGLRTIGIALALGLGGSLLATRLLEAQLFGVQATDPLVFITVPVVLALVALAACYMPARRASSVDPVAALRGE